MSTRFPMLPARWAHVSGIADRFPNKADEYRLGSGLKGIKRGSISYNNSIEK